MPKPCETVTRKTAKTSPAERTKSYRAANSKNPWKSLQEVLLPKRLRDTQTAAGFEPMPNKMQPDKMLPVTFGIHKKQKQFSCPAPYRLRGIVPKFRNHWHKSLGGPALQAIESPASITVANRCKRCFCQSAFETPEQAAGFESTERTKSYRISTASKTVENRCKRCFCRSAFETLKQQQDSSP